MHFNIKYIILPLLCLHISVWGQVDSSGSSLQQQNVNTDEQLKTKLGVKFTLGLHTFRGDAFDNEKLLYGFGTGLYNVIKLNPDKTVNLHWELNLTFRGSRFGNVNDTSYSKISVAYMDLPVYLSLQLFNTKSHQPMHLLIGGQFSYLFRSSINKSYGKFGEVKTNLPFQRVDVFPCLGVRKEIGSGMSVQLCAKMGLLNNYSNSFYNNPEYKDITPSFKDGTHQNRNMSLELSFLF